MTAAASKHGAQQLQVFFEREIDVVFFGDIVRRDVTIKCSELSGSSRMLSELPGMILFSCWVGNGLSGTAVYLPLPAILNRAWSCNTGKSRG